MQQRKVQIPHRHFVGDVENLNTAVEFLTKFLCIKSCAFCRSQALRIILGNCSNTKRTMIATTCVHQLWVKFLSSVILHHELKSLPSLMLHQVCQQEAFRSRSCLPYVVLLLLLCLPFSNQQSKRISSWPTAESIESSGHGKLRLIKQHGMTGLLWFFLFLT